jgi:myo-inositol-1(or 4)-monophosphatase
VLPAVGDIRRVGSAAISLCWVACGRLDAFYETGLEPWDFAAGSLIALEAGADVQGAECDRANGHLIIASAPTVTAGLRQILREKPWDSQ